MGRKRSSISHILHEVDPNLTIITRSKGRKSNARNWEMAAGSECPRCHQKALRFRTTDGVCIACVQAIEEKTERDDNKRAKILKYVKAHNARITKKRG